MKGPMPAYFHPRVKTPDCPRLAVHLVPSPDDETRPWLWTVHAPVVAGRTHPVRQRLAQGRAATQGWALEVGLRNLSRQMFDWMRAHDPNAQALLAWIEADAERQAQAALAAFPTLEEWLVRNFALPEWRVGGHYGIHVYQGDRPVATFHREADASAAVDAVNRTRRTR